MAELPGGLAPDGLAAGAGPADAVALDVRRKLVSRVGAEIEYGVILNDDLTVNEAATRNLRAQLVQTLV